MILNFLLNIIYRKYSLISGFYIKQTLNFPFGVAFDIFFICVFGQKKCASYRRKA